MGGGGGSALSSQLIEEALASMHCKLFYFYFRSGTGKISLFTVVRQGGGGPQTAG